MSRLHNWRNGFVHLHKQRTQLRQLPSNRHRRETRLAAGIDAKKRRQETLTRELEEGGELEFEKFVRDRGKMWNREREFLLFAIILSLTDSEDMDEDSGARRVQQKSGERKEKSEQFDVSSHVPEMGKTLRIVRKFTNILIV